MNGKIHFTTGVLCATALGIYLYDKRMVDASTVLSMSGIGACSALLPDLDTQKSTIGKTVPVIPWLLENFFGHRGFFHSFLPLILLFLTERFFFPFSIYSEIAFFTGWTSHLLLDTLTPMGIMWLYPLSKKRYSLNRKRVIRKSYKLSGNKK